MVGYLTFYNSHSILEQPISLLYADIELFRVHFIINKQQQWQSLRNLTSLNLFLWSRWWVGWQTVRITSYVTQPRFAKSGRLTGSGLWLSGVRLSRIRLFDSRFSLSRWTRRDVGRTRTYEFFVNVWLYTANVSFMGSCGYVCLQCMYIYHIFNVLTLSCKIAKSRKHRVLKVTQSFSNE